MHPLPIIDPKFKALIPPLTPEEREQLEHNILANRKCHDPIILWEGLVIDGHNRFGICVKHGIEFRIEEMPLASREEAIVWILNNQLSRRNLTDAAKIETALLKTEMLREKAQRNLTRGGRPKKGGEKSSSLSSKPEADTVDVRKVTAAEAGISIGKLSNYMQIKEHGNPELLQKVKSGELKIGTAHRLLEKEILKQLRKAAKMINFVTRSTPIAGCEATNPEANLFTLLTHLANCGASYSGRILRNPVRYLRERQRPAAVLPAHATQEVNMNPLKTDKCF